MFEPAARFRQRLAQGQILAGAGIYLTDPKASEALADTFDFLWYDLEHSPMSMEALGAHLMVARGKNKPAIVRVGGSDTAFIKPVLDAGAHGIVVPQVRSPEEVQRAVDDCRYPPLGRRGFGPLIPTNYGRRGGPEYVARANAQLFVSVMIETAEAVAAIDQIVAIPGLDSVVLGPWDLSGSLGMLGEVGHPRVVAALEKVIASARGAGLSVGSGMPADPEFAALQVRRGVQWLQMGGDCGYLVAHADQMVRQLRQRLA
jgi:2-dehydro-3-deoxyglucarate aldolase/4-hydroxy-2-oxoheptanedioate aldolase